MNEREKRFDMMMENKFPDNCYDCTFCHLKENLTRCNLLDRDIESDVYSNRADFCTLPR